MRLTKKLYGKVQNKGIRNDGSSPIRVPEASSCGNFRYTFQLNLERRKAKGRRKKSQLKEVKQYVKIAKSLKQDKVNSIKPVSDEEKT